MVIGVPFRRGEAASSDLKVSILFIHTKGMPVFLPVSLPVFWPVSGNLPLSPRPQNALRPAHKSDGINHYRRDF
jgi:hypothetical protein